MRAHAQRHACVCTSHSGICMLARTSLHLQGSSRRFVDFVDDKHLLRLLRLAILFEAEQMGQTLDTLVPSHASATYDEDM